ncbi:MAG: GIY-YIG nuclease family protein [Dokdonella sp.]|uniref:GIY-YIG nuclease family protein n=2 Tax=Dokdonella sp. TaxID=2291710 RepID=UPI002CEC77D0|nr:GIY-YIG nuclease family protein [Xanthomonadales bacterium]MBK7210182.1 GIY-YIG nuclease family protein [Xanthomonadales bacterium]MBL0223630.1 GIY-YIG nuclease family protein [Xanthomonadales bacterium]HQZ63157.1 GIY-YIG nuclease family protein [Dokdonella sp.]
MAFTVYMLECADGSLYVGHSDNLELRMQQHDSGTGNAYTATRRPLRLLHAEAFETRYEALTMERKLKGWSHAKKLAWVRGDWDAIKQLAQGPRRRKR